jgi:hypothetical protein
MRVYAAKENVRQHVRHPQGGKFNAAGVGNWPNDAFTQRRLRDGDITLEAPPAGAAGQQDQQTAAPAAPVAVPGEMFDPAFHSQDFAVPTGASATAAPPVPTLPPAAPAQQQPPQSTPPAEQSAQPAAAPPPSAPPPTNGSGDGQPTQPQTSSVAEDHDSTAGAR